MAETVLVEHNEQGVVQICLNRPEVHNAFDDLIIAKLIQHLDELSTDNTVRMLILRAQGKHFSAGADLGWMRRMADNSHQENLDDAAQLGQLMQRLNHFNKPTIALVQGAAYGGAVGLAACCDMVIATHTARFCLSEVRIGLIPAVISPYVVRAIGERQARRYFLSAEVFSASQAKTYGLVHEVVSDVDELEGVCQQFIANLQHNSPQAVSAAKDLIFTVTHKPIEADLIQESAKRIADIRVSAEGQEGLTAFLDKRQPNWIKE